MRECCAVVEVRQRTSLVVDIDHIAAAAAAAGGKVVGSHEEAEVEFGAEAAEELDSCSPISNPEVVVAFGSAAVEMDREASRH